ncbi:MAG: peptidyl-prolyl cis-trans isomerase [Phycisphaeraceae bacterium]|nr:peptidyl-prolyl cis-trans isomerase [Phycisphaeraceae bacterium]
MRTEATILTFATAALLALCGLAACRSDESRPQPARVTAERFAPRHAPPADEPPAADARPADQPAPTAPARPPRTQPPAAAMRADTLPIRSFIGEPELAPALHVAPAADSVVLESVIGQINGRPVFASEILDPLDGKLRAIAERVGADRTAFRNESAMEVLGVLQKKIRDELILAEARSSLTPEQQQGLFFFLGQVQRSMVSQQAGSRLLADEATRESSGRTLQQEARDQLELRLIEHEINRKIYSRVNIPWRLVRQEYERDPDRFNQPGVAVFRVISVPMADAERVRAAEQAIAEKPFAEAAAMDFNAFLRDTGGLQRREFRGELSQAGLFAAPLNDAARALNIGETAGPIRWDNALAWLHLESVEPPISRSLYDAQMELDLELRDRKRRAESEVYFMRLLSRGSFTEIERMIEQVLAIAAERYLPTRVQ